MGVKALNKRHKFCYGGVQQHINWKAEREISGDKQINSDGVISHELNMVMNRNLIPRKEVFEFQIQISSIIRGKVYESSR